MRRRQRAGMIPAARRVAPRHGLAQHVRCIHKRFAVARALRLRRAMKTTLLVAIGTALLSLVGCGDSSTSAPLDATVSDGSSVDASNCGTMSCAANQVCVRDQTLGGAVFVPDDAGMCPTGRIPQGGSCVSAPTYSCAPRPAACTGALSCACAASLCANSRTCVAAAGIQVNCELQAP